MNPPKHIALKGYEAIIITPKYTRNGLFKRFIPKGVPLGAGLITAYACKMGLPVLLLDEETMSITPNFLKAVLDKCGKPRIIGISCVTNNIARGYQIADLIKSIDRQAVIIFGGIHPTVMPEEVLLHSCDYVVMGEGEYIFTDLCQQIKAGFIRPEKLSGVAFRNNGKTVYSHGFVDTVDLDKLPIFPYDRIDPTKYDLGYIISSRGCPHHCIYCSPRAISKNRHVLPYF